MRTDLAATIGAIGFVLFLLNVTSLAVIWLMRRKTRQVGDWPATTGIITASALETQERSKGGPIEYPLVRYSYQVGGQAFQGINISPGPEVGGLRAWKSLERYPTGAQVTVFYNPENPADAVLEKAAPAQAMMWMMLGIFDCTICVAIPLVWWALSRR